MQTENKQPEFERLVIGAILKKPELTDHLDLAPEMFSSGVFRDAFEAIDVLRGSGEAIDVFTVANRLDTTTVHGGWVRILSDAMGECYAPGNAKLYATKIREAHRGQEAKAIAATLAQSVGSDGLDAVDTAIRDLMALGGMQKRHEMGMPEACQQAVDQIDRIYNLEGALPGVATGLHEMDKILGGFHDSDLTVIAARPSMGKTALLLNLALAANKPAGIISAEQPAVQVGIRCIAMNGRMNANKLRNADLCGEDWPMLTASVSKLAEKNIRINEKSGISIAEVVRQARTWKHHHGTGILYVDYIQRIKASNQRVPRHEQVGEVVMTLKELARDLKIPVVALAQVNREVEKRVNKRPAMGDIKDSGTVEQEADVIMSLYRDEVYDKESKDIGTAEIDVLKNRHGPNGFIRVTWLSKSMRFVNHEQRDQWSGPVDQEHAQ